MSYAINDECIDRIGQATLAKYHGGTYAPSKLKSSRAGAAATINAFLSGLEPVPIDTSSDPTVEVSLRECELALVEFMEAGREDISEIAERIVNKNKAALDWLKEIRDGKARIRPFVTVPIQSVRKRRVRIPSYIEQVVEFNYETVGEDGDYDAEMGDSGQALYIPQDSGQIVAMAFRGYSMPGAAADDGAIVTLAAALNGEQASDELQFDWTNATLRGSILEVNLASAVAFAAGDQLSLIVTEAGAAEGCSVKAWMRLRMDTECE